MCARAFVTFWCCIASVKLLDESAGEPVSSTHVPMAGFATEAEAIAEYNKHPKLHLGVVVFQLWPRDRQHQSTHRWLYKIRLGGRSAPPTGARFVRAGDPEGVTGGAASDSWKAWSDSGFLQLQQAIDAAIVAFEGSTHPTLPHRLFKQLPSGVDGATVRSTWERLVDALMPMFGVSMGAGVLLQQFVAEKELKIRDGMLVMGVHDATYVHVALTALPPWLTALSRFSVGTLCGLHCFTGTTSRGCLCPGRFSSLQ